MSSNNNNNTQQTDLSQLKQEENSVIDPNGNNTNNIRPNNNFNNHVKVNRDKSGLSDDDVSYESNGSNDDESNNNNNNTQDDIDLVYNLIQQEQMVSISSNNGGGNNNTTHGYYTRSKRSPLRDLSDNNNNGNNNNSNSKDRQGKGKGEQKYVGMNTDDNANIASKALKNMENIKNIFLSPSGSNDNNTNDKNGDYGNNNRNNNLNKNMSNNSKWNKNKSSKRPNAGNFHYRYRYPSHLSGYSQSQWNTRSNATAHPMFNPNASPNTISNNNNNNSSGNNGNNRRAYDRAARGSDEYGHKKYRFDPTRQPISRLEMQNYMLSSIEMRDKALAQFAPLMFKKVLDGDTNVNERIFIIEVLRQIDIFNRIPNYDKNSFLQREIPFKNMDLVHTIINQCLKYFMKKLRDTINEDNVDTTKQLQIIDIMTQISELANEYVRDQGEHTQISWIYTIITVINNNVKTGTILADFERKKSDLETPGNKKVLFGGRNTKVHAIPDPQKEHKNKNNYNNNNNSTNN